MRSPVSESVDKAGVLRRMLRREQKEWWWVKYGKKRIAKTKGSDSRGFQSSYDALVDGVWMLKECRVIPFFAPEEVWDWRFGAKLGWGH